LPEAVTPAITSGGLEFKRLAATAGTL
jgi:hypothetical protein